MAFLLHESDWQRFPTAIIDYNTRNPSFLRLAQLYKNMGIRNNAFLLALLQPELSGIDPYDPELSTEIKTKIHLECLYNPWYYFREVARVPPNSGSIPRQFEANRGNIALYWSFFNHIDFGLLQPRQTGKSVSTDILLTGVNFIWARNTDIYLITKDSALRAKNVARLKDIRDLLPDYIFNPSRMDANNTEVITNSNYGNNYRTAVGRNDWKSADKLGRGLTVPIIHFDELAYIDLIEATMPVALSSGSFARDEAEQAGQPWGNIFTTTAGSINSRDGKYAHQFLTSGMPWSEILLDAGSQQAAAKMVDDHSTGIKPIIYGAFNHRQLGRTDEWLKRKLRENAASGELADRDFFNIWTSGTEGSPLTPQQKRLARESKIETAYTQIWAGYVLRWFLPFEDIDSRMANGRFVLSMDTSDALGGENDATTMVLMDIETHDVVAAGRYNETSLDRLARFFLTEFLVRYPNVTLIVERKSSGMTLMDILMVQLPLQGVDPFKRLYNRVVDEKETNFRTDYQEIMRNGTNRQPQVYDRYKRYFGFATSGSGRHAREALFSENLKNALHYGVRKLHDPTLIDELLSMTIRNDRIDHQNQAHDDMVIAWLLGHWFCTKARHLSHYGIDSQRVFINADVGQQALTPEEQYHRSVKEQKREQFNTLIEELKNSQDNMTIARLESQLQHLSRMVDVQELTGVGLDAMFQQAHEERQRRTKINRHNNPYSQWSNVRRFG